ncbi:hypothetical protein [uncultured Roseobacter sp.]|uniref:hypothetical protein n=1 Tax=uncultured Roseobacter sp. TaxID=114847 RepID=UPI00260383C4|nr:hypothetical protein [uncultured Roseobacter sp.]
MRGKPVVYHMCPPNLRGNLLLPLDALRKEHPDLYAAKMAKYRGRETIPTRPLPELKCRWCDCVQFSTVHPEAIRDAMLRAGHSWPDNGRRFFGVSVDEAGFSAGNTVIWRYEDAGPAADIAAAKSDIVPYSPGCVAELDALHHRTEKYFQEMHALGCRPLLFVGVPHLLHRGPVSLKHADEIVV